MFIRTTASLCAAGLLAGFAITAQADPFVSGSLARTSTKFNNIKDGTGFSLAGGYSFDSLRYPVFIEGSYYDSGTMKVKDQDVKLSYDGIQVYGGVAYKLPNGGSMVWGKAGYYSLDQKATGSLVSGSEKGSGITLGLGGDWMFSGSLGARFEIETPFKVKSFNDNGSGKTQLSIIKIGLVWRPHFLGGGSAVAETPADQPAAVVTPINTAAAPVSPAAASLTSGSSVVIRAGTALRAQPKPDSRALSTTGTDTPMTISGSSTNTTGTWWFVKGGALSGWVLSSEFAP